MGDTVALTNDWAQSPLDRMGFVKRKATTKAKISVEEIENNFLFDIEAFTTLEDIPESLIFNWDQTAIKYVPVPDWTVEKKGTKRVKLAGLDDKRQNNSSVCYNDWRTYRHSWLIKAQPMLVCQPTNFLIHGISHLQQTIGATKRQ